MIKVKKGQNKSMEFCKPHDTNNVITLTIMKNSDLIELLKSYKKGEVLTEYKVSDLHNNKKIGNFFIEFYKNNDNKEKELITGFNFEYDQKSLATFLRSDEDSEYDEKVKLFINTVRLVPSKDKFPSVFHVDKLDNFLKNEVNIRLSNKKIQKYDDIMREFKIDRAIKQAFDHSSSDSPVIFSFESFLEFFCLPVKMAKDLHENRRKNGEEEVSFSSPSDKPVKTGNSFLDMFLNGLKNSFKSKGNNVEVTVIDLNKDSEDSDDNEEDPNDPPSINFADHVRKVDPLHNSHCKSCHNFNRCCFIMTLLEEGYNDNNAINISNALLDRTVQEIKEASAIFTTKDNVSSLMVNFEKKE